MARCLLVSLIALVFIVSGCSGGDDAAQTIVTTPLNNPPVAVNDALSAVHGITTSLNLAVNDSDADDGLDLTSITIVAAPANGSVVVKSDGTVDYTHNGTVTISDTFTYTIKDNSVAVSNTATVTLTINNPPVAVNDASTLGEGMPVTIDLADNDTDADDGLDLGSITVVAPPANGSVVVNADGTVNYIHDGSETISDMFTYSIKDNSGAASNTAAVNITVIPVNDLPVAVNDASTLGEGMAAALNLADNDTDVDDGLDLGSITVIALPVNGSVVVNANGTVNYSHDGSETVSDMFTYSIKDNSGETSNTAAVNITVTPVNDLPAAVNDASTLNEGMAATINLADNDTDVDDGLDLGSIVVAQPANGSVVVNADGTVNYIHDGSETVSDVFTYSIKDNSGAASNTANVNITVLPVNDLPVAVNDASTVVKGSAITVDLAINDSDADDGLDIASITIVAAPANGSTIVNADGSVEYTHDGSDTVSDTFTYTIKDVSGAVSNTATVTLTIIEFVSIGGTIFDLNNTGEQSVEVEGVYSNPGDPQNPIMATDANGNFSFQVLKNDAVYLHASKNNFATINTAKVPYDADITGVERVMPTAVEAQSVIDTALGGANLLVNHAWLMIDVEDASGNEISGHIILSIPVPVDEVYTNCDGTDSGGAATTGPCVQDRQGTMYIAYFDSPTEANVTVGSETQIAPIRMGEITVLEFEVAAIPVNNPPDAVNDALSAVHGITTNLNLAVNDSDADDGLDLTSITIVADPANGSVVVKSDGTVDYTHDGTATTSDAFTYTIKDNSGAVSNTATVTLTINIPPVAVNDTLSAVQGITTNLDLAINDSDADNGLNLASITIVTVPANGSVVVKSDGTVDYTHNGTATTSDTFTYTIKDNSDAESNTATVTITVFGSFAAGQTKYDLSCASCHAAGSYDPVPERASDLYNDGEKLVTNLRSLGGMNSVSDITTQELLDLKAFLEDPSIAP